MLIAFLQWINLQMYSKVILYDTLFNRNKRIQKSEKTMLFFLYKLLHVNQNILTKS